MKLPSALLESLRQQGIPVAKAFFKKSIRNEDHFDINELRSDRRATMLITPMGLLVEQKGKNLALIPTASLKWCDLFEASLKSIKIEEETGAETETLSEKRKPGRPKASPTQETRPSALE